MSWNYRIVKSYDKLTDPQGDKHPMLNQPYYSIRDVYYDKKGNPENWGAEPQHPIGSTLEELLEDFVHMASAIDKPLLLEHGNRLTVIKSPKLKKKRR